MACSMQKTSTTVGLLLLCTLVGCGEAATDPRVGCGAASACDAGSVDAGGAGPVDAGLGAGSEDASAGADSSTGDDAGTPPTDSSVPQVDAGPPRDVPDFDGCPGNGEPFDVFNSFWSQFDRNYAVFDARLKGLTWRAVGSDACPSIRSGMSDDELFDVLLGMIRMLDDGHTGLEAPNIGRYSDAMVSSYDTWRQVNRAEGLIEDQYLDGNYSSGAGGDVRWGRIGNIGYISCTSMGSENGSDRAMANAMSDFAGVDGVIIDVRANGGGYDATALAIAKWFPGSRTVAWREQERDGPAYDDFTEMRDVFVNAAPNAALDVPTVVLVSGATFSAAETFLLAMQVRENVTFVGERTTGHLSDIFGGRLPNGWRFDYSGERYTAADGSYYEGTGIPMDVEVPVDVEAFDNNRDNMLEAALDLLAP